MESATLDQAHVLPVKDHLKGVLRTKNAIKSRHGFLRLDKNENTVPFPASLVSKIRKEVTAEFLMTYPEVGPLYERIAKWLKCKVSNLYLSSGSDGAIKTVFEVFVEAGDTVMLLDPTYAMFNVYVKLFQAHLSPIKYGPGLSLEKESIIRQIKNEKPRLVCIANPNSPTGTVLTLSKIEEIVKQAERSNSVVMIDEAYGLYWPETAVSLIEKYPHLVVTKSFSKALGLAAVRLGITIGHPEIISHLQTFRPMYETNALAVKAAIIVLDSYPVIEDNVKKTLEGKSHLEEELTKRGLPFYKSFANFVNIKVGSPEKAALIASKLYNEKILIAVGFKDALLKDCIRVSVGSIRQMDVFLKALDGALR